MSEWKVGKIETCKSGSSSIFHGKNRISCDRTCRCIMALSVEPTCRRDIPRPRRVPEEEELRQGDPPLYRGLVTENNHKIDFLQIMMSA